MNTGQMSMMPVNAGIPAPSSAQPSSPATVLPDSGDQAGGLFSGLLEGMTPQNTLRGTAVPVSDGKDAPASEKNVKTAATTALQDGLSGLMAGMPNMLDAAGKPLAAGTEQGTGVRTTALGSGRKPQDVALNADGLQMALLIQVNSGRMLQDDGTVAQLAGGPVPSVTEGSTEVPAPADASDKKPQDVALNADGMLAAQIIQANSGRMPQDDGAVAQQPIDAAVTDAAVATLSSSGGAPGIFAATSGDADGSLKGSSAGSSALGVASHGNELQQASGKQPDTAPLPFQQVSTIAGQKDQAVGSGMGSTERGTASSDQKGSASGSGVPAFSSATPVKGDSEALTAASSGIKVTAQSQQEVTLFRSAPLEVALAESVSRNEAGTTGQTQNVSSAQSMPAAEIPAASTEKTTQTALQQDAHTAKSGPMPVPVTLSPVTPQPSDQTVTATNRTLEVTRSLQAAVAPAAEKVGAEAGGEAVQARPESAVVTKPMQNIALETVKFAGAESSGEGFSTGDDKGMANNFMNGQFHTTLMHQQGGTDGASATSTVAAPIQNNTQQSGLSEQILQQVKDRLVNHEVKAGNDQIVLRLSPENLGNLKVNLTMDGQSLKVEIVAENNTVRNTLLQNTDSLKESLARQNISMESFDVTTNGRSAGNPGQGQQQSGWREFAQQRQQSAWMSSGGYRLPDVAAVSSQVAYQKPSLHAMVDLHF